MDHNCEQAALDHGQGFSAPAQRAIRAARQLAGAHGVETGPEHLLLATVVEPYSIAPVVLIHLEHGPARIRQELERRGLLTDAAPAGELAPVSEGLRQAISDTFVRVGDVRQPGTADLLSTLAGERGAVGDLLRGLGVTPERIEPLRYRYVPEAEGLPRPDRIRPAVVPLVAGVLVLHGSCACFPFLGGLLIAVDGLGRSQRLELLLPLLLCLSQLWTVVGALLLIGPMLKARRSAWSRVMAGLLAKTMAASGFAALTLPHALPMGISLLVVAGFQLGLTWGFFRARDWFGVEKRWGYRTLWREAWWVLVVTALPDLTLLGILAASMALLPR